MSTGMIDQGMYDAAEVARFIGMGIDSVVGLSINSAHGPAVVPPTFRRLFSFADLLTFDVAKILTERGVSDRHLRAGVASLRVRTGQANPLALATVLDRLATSGVSFLAAFDSEDYEDIGAGGHGVFQNVVRLYLKTVSFGDAGQPISMSPAPRVTVNPKIQAGAPCVTGTRIPTATIADLLESEDESDIASDFDISVADVRAAAAFEAMLDTGSGIAA
jgi:uncharacterized protein (DUF433 family)